MKLQNQAQLELPVTFEQIVPSDYWRVHPLQPLAAGAFVDQNRVECTP